MFVDKLYLLRRFLYVTLIYLVKMPVFQLILINIFNPALYMSRFQSNVCLLEWPFDPCYVFSRQMYRDEVNSPRLLGMAQEKRA